MSGKDWFLLAVSAFALAMALWSAAYPGILRRRYERRAARTRALYPDHNRGESK